MRSHSFLRKTHLLLKQSPTIYPIRVQPIHIARTLRHKRSGLSQIFHRNTSSNAAPPNEPETSSTIPSFPQNGEAESSSAPETELTAEDPDKVVVKPRRTRVISSSSNAKEVELPELPVQLEDDILYVPTESQGDSHTKDSLPPPEMFHEALDNLMIALHPKNQYRSIIASGPGHQLVEPTLGLYCPIEGGDYVIDLTVQELAYQTSAEVLVLDSAHLAAGEWGMFGKAGSALQLPDNPLHFSAPPPPPSNRSGKLQEDREDDFEDEKSPFMLTPTRISLAIPKIVSSPLNRGIISSNTRKTPSPSKLESFFEAIVNLPLPPPSNESSSHPKSRPRIIYIRDFPMLAPSSSIWYPPLLAAVRQRRRRLLSRTSDISSSSVAIVFGMTPPLTHPNGSSSGSSTNLINLLTNRTASSSLLPLGGKNEHTPDWGEGEAAETAREKRLRVRLRKWEKNATSLHEELPSLSSVPEAESSPKSNIIVVGGSELPMPMPQMLGFDDSEPPADTSSRFFRSTILVPRSRSTGKERESRVARRREINELTMRMGVGAIGGIIEADPASSHFVPSAPSSDTTVSEDTPPNSSPSNSIWEDWGNKVEFWSEVRRVSDRAMGSVMASRMVSPAQNKSAFSSTIVPWSAILTAWKSSHIMAEARKSWLKETIGAHPIGDDGPGEKERLENAGSGTDKVVETIKNDPDLDSHEARLLPCIVDSLTITTTFKQVHLPSHTIDSIRTIVSLPLLHPNAFKEGILKEHTMTGCLLFGPPGTGKTLAVRALAKEAGCRMLAISPSDVMDMYVGEGEKLVRAVFSLARKLSPCVIFLDEIDALFGARMSARESGSAFAHRGIITEFMQEMDGLKSSKEDNVIVIGATNRPFDLDDAVLRRLPRRLLVDLPGEKERTEILKILLRDEALADDVSIEALSKKTDGFSGSDLKHLAVSAALDSIKEHLHLPWSSRHNVAAPVSSPTTLTPTAIEPSTGLKDESETHEPPIEEQQRSKPDEEDVLEASSRRSRGPDSSSSKDLDPHKDASETGKAPLEQRLTPGAEDVLKRLGRILANSPSVEEASHTSESSSLKDSAEPDTSKRTRTLHLRNFTQALKEITPSSSESLGSLADLRKWNEEFGEGRKDRKKRQVWGKGRFGFVNEDKDQGVGDGRVAKG